MNGPWEVEQKYVVEDMAALKQSLLAAGFEQVSAERNVDTYLRHPSRDFRATDEALRIRCLEGSSCITYKGKRLPGVVKLRPEIELSIVHAERDAWLTIFQQLGFTALPTVEKQREFYRPGADSEYADSKILVALDDVHLLGSFAEIEIVVAAENELEPASAEIQGLAQVLGLNTVQPRSYLSLLLAKLELE